MNRPSYHHGNLRAALVAAGTELIAESGVEAVNMRELARRAGVSSAAPYRHFADKDTLLAAIAAQGFERLVDRMREVVADADDASEGFARQGMAFSTFAIANPAHFRVMYLPHLHDEERFPDVVALSQEATGLLFGQIKAAQQAGLVANFDVQHIALAALALVYGTTRLFVDGVIPDSDPCIAQQVTAAVIEVMGKGIAPRAGQDSERPQSIATIQARLMPFAGE